MLFWNVITRRRESREHATLVKAYRKVFSGEAGRLVLDDLCAVLRQVHWPDADEANSADVRAFTDGQKSLALRVLGMLDG